MSWRAHHYLACLQGNTNSTEQGWYMETGVFRRDSLKHENQHPDHSKRRTVFVREYELADNAKVLSIFYDGLMEMIPDTAFRALRHHPESLLLYSALTGEVTTKYRRRHSHYFALSQPLFSMKPLVAFQCITGCSNGSN